MIALVQRVSKASVVVDAKTVGEIPAGILILLGVHEADTDLELDWVARKCANLRIFPDSEGKMNLSVGDIGGGVLVVSQFTLYGTVGKGNRPSYNAAAAPGDAEPLFDRFVERIGSELGVPIETGVFGAMMEVHLVNDGPVTVWVEKAPSEAGQIRSAPS